MRTRENRYVIIAKSTNFFNLLNKLFSGAELGLYKFISNSNDYCKFGVEFHHRIFLVMTPTQLLCSISHYSKGIFGLFSLINQLVRLIGDSSKIKWKI